MANLYRVDEMESLIRTTLEVPSQSHISSVTILQAINDGYKEVASRAFCIENEDTVALVSGNRQVGFSGHRVNAIEYQTTGSSGSGGDFAEAVGPYDASWPMNMVGLTYGEGLYIACGTFGGYTALIFSTTDLVTWTLRNSISGLTGADAKALAYNGSVFCLVGGPSNLSGNTGNIMTSADGITWGNIYPALNFRGFRGICSDGAGTFIAVGDEYAIANVNVLKSTDGAGAVWSNKSFTSSPSGMSGGATAYGNGIYVLVGGSIGITGYAAYSTDGGDTWNNSTMPSTPLYLGAVYWAGTKFIAVGEDGEIVVSTDGVAWTRKTSGTILDLAAVTYNGTEVYVCGEAGGGDAILLKSIDAGDTWVEISNPHNTTLRAATFGGNKVVLIGNVDADGDAYCLKSDYTSLTTSTPIKTLLKVRPETFGHIAIKDYTPQYWCQWGDKVLVEPVPDAAYSLKLYTSDYPTTQLTATTDYPTSLPGEFQPCIVDFACYAIALNLRKWGKASLYYNRYITNLKKRRNNYINRKVDQRRIRSIPNKVVYEGGQPWQH